jgi:4-amino-4-deoxy-L-arabinose transferase-like glycosyltransferase
MAARHDMTTHDSSTRDIRLLAPIERLVGALTDPARCERAVVGVLVAYTLCWTLYGVLAKGNQGIHYDMAELVMWAREPALGYPKHPPLAAWLVGGWFSLLPFADWAFYLLAITFASLALWLAWRLFARFLDPQKRVVALALLTLVPFFNFHVLKFDHNAVLMPLWPLATLCFLRSFETRSAGWAALAGAAAALAMLGKYWSIFLLAGLGLAALVDPRRGGYFRSAAPWITVAVGAAVLAPHVAWLVTHGFAPFAYAREAHMLDFLATLKSVGGYLAGAAGYVALPVLLALAASRPSGAALADMLDPRPPGRRFAAAAFWVPLLLPCLVALATGLELNSTWTGAGWILLPVVLLASPLIVIGRQAMLAIVAFATLLPPLVTAAAPAIAYVAHRAGVPPPAAHAQLLAERLEREWRQVTDRPLLIVGGELDLAYSAAFYLPDRPVAYPTDLWRLAPWVDGARIAREGISLVCYSRDDDRGGRTCVHHGMIDAFEAMAARAPGSRRAEVEITRRYLGVAGKPMRYLIFSVPPQPR